MQEFCYLGETTPRQLALVSLRRPELQTAQSPVSTTRFSGSRLRLVSRMKRWYITRPKASGLFVSSFGGGSLLARGKLAGLIPVRAFAFWARAVFRLFIWIAAQVNEALCKILAHNLCCLIQNMLELKVKPEFWQGIEIDGFTGRA